MYRGWAFDMNSHAVVIKALTKKVSQMKTVKSLGRLEEIRGPVARVALRGVEQGALCMIARRNQPDLLAEVTSIKENSAIISPFGSTDGLAVGAIVRSTSAKLMLPTGDGLLGRVLDAFGKPIDDIGTLQGEIIDYPIKSEPLSPMDRPIIDSQIETGLRVLDGMMTIGSGQRIGVFGPPGTGKSSLLAAIARQVMADVIIICLVGERGREVREFIERDLPLSAREKVIVVAATSDRPAIERALCAHSATAIAESFRDRGKSVFLMVDSLTRTARALREVGLAAGETPTRRGFPASVYPQLPLIIERAGRSKSADITALYTVLTEGDENSDPIAQEVKSLTDGHIVLSQQLASQGHYPAIDVVQSLSRCMTSIVTDEHNKAANKLRALIVKYQEIELLLQMGEYKPGSDLFADQAIAARSPITDFLTQGSIERSDIDTTLRLLKQVAR